MNLKGIVQKYNRLLHLQIPDFHGQQISLLKDTCEFSTFVIKNTSDIKAFFKNDNQIKTFVNLFANGFYSIIYKHNQFIFIPENYKKKINFIYQTFIKQLLHVLNIQSLIKLEEKAIVNVLNAHFQELFDVLTQFKDSILEDACNINLKNQKIVCLEYSVQLQLKLLSMDLKNLKEPILDIGCGENAALVAYLSKQGYDVTGIDRHIIHPNKNVKTADWFSFPYKKHYWGTIISQMAFSNHFIFQHLNIHGNPELYAKTYMSILKSLVKGGSFYYTPGLPFIEEHLPRDEYKITIEKLNTNIFSAFDNDFQQFKRMYLYSSRIIRIED